MTSTRTSSSRRRWCDRVQETEDGIRVNISKFRTLVNSIMENHLERDGGHKKRFQYCTDSTGGEILYLRVIRGHSGENPVDPSLQDNVLIPTDFFEYIYHVGSNLNVHSVSDSGLIPGRNSSRRCSSQP